MGDFVTVLIRGLKIGENKVGRRRFPVVFRSRGVENSFWMILPSNAVRSIRIDFPRTMKMPSIVARSMSSHATFISLQLHVRRMY